jgi:signal transduction histidine kinase
VRRRILEATIASVTVAVVLLGVPLAIFGMLMVRDDQVGRLELRAEAIARSVERRLASGEVLDDSMLEGWVSGDAVLPARITVISPDGQRYQAGPELNGPVTAASAITPSGAAVVVAVASSQVLLQALRVLFLVVIASALAFAAGIVMAYWQARRLAAPLIYLAASAEQLGSGQARPRLKPTGVEEIDLVADELARSADRMAGRLAAERQFASNASHQLRTPLTALSMRLEEIQDLAESDDVREEARISLEQVERLGAVIDDLLASSRRTTSGTTEVIHLDDVFRQQEEEWGRTFGAAGRWLDVDYGSGVSVLATPGGVAQILATLLENSLKYGAGTTSVRARRSGATGVVIEVADQGPGVPDELAPRIFERSVSGGRGTGLGLALAKELAEADGGRLSLAQRRPPVFALFLNAAPRRLDPDVVLPPGALVAVGRRRRRR